MTLSNPATHAAVQAETARLKKKLTDRVMDEIQSYAELEKKYGTAANFKAMMEGCKSIRLPIPIMRPI